MTSCMLKSRCILYTWKFKKIEKSTFLIFIFYKLYKILNRCQPMILYHSFFICIIAYTILPLEAAGRDVLGKLKLLQNHMNIIFKSEKGKTTNKYGELNENYVNS